MEKDPVLEEFSQEGKTKKANPWLRSDPGLLDGILAQLYDLMSPKGAKPDPYTRGPNFGAPMGPRAAQPAPMPTPTPQPQAAAPGQADPQLAQLMALLNGRSA